MEIPLPLIVDTPSHISGLQIINASIRGNKLITDFWTVLPVQGIFVSVTVSNTPAFFYKKTQFLFRSPLLLATFCLSDN